MPTDDAPTRQEVALALRILERWGRLGTATPTPTPRKQKQETRYAESRVPACESGRWTFRHPPRARLEGPPRNVSEDPSRADALKLISFVRSPNPPRRNWSVPVSSDCGNHRSSGRRPTTASLRSPTSSRDDRREGESPAPVPRLRLSHGREGMPRLWLLRSLRRGTRG